ncbi:MAG: FHA domain-containing protein [Cyanobacteriota bacterium]|nr:FHA domain-containing protein [Cyanobacteriota bacterium]
MTSSYPHPYQSITTRHGRSTLSGSTPTAYSPVGHPLDHQLRQTSPASPNLLDALLRNLKYDLEQVANVIDPILTAAHHCRVSGRYLQGIMVGNQGFMTSNLNRRQYLQVTPCGSNWLIGRGVDCPLLAVEFGVAPYHARLSFNPEVGFSLTDLGTAMGTLVNGKPLIPSHPYHLQEGDVIAMGRLCFEFFEEFCLPYDDDDNP